LKGQEFKGVDAKKLKAKVKPSLHQGLRRDPAMHNQVKGIYEKWQKFGTPKYCNDIENGSTSQLTQSLTNSVLGLSKMPSEQDYSLK